MPSVSRRGCLLLPLDQQGVEVGSRDLDELAEEAALNKGAGTRGIPDVAALADVEERHLVPRHEGRERIVVVRDHGFWRDAIAPEGRGLFGQSVDRFPCLAGRHDRCLIHSCLPGCEDACSVHAMGTLSECGPRENADAFTFRSCRPKPLSFTRE